MMQLFAALATTLILSATPTTQPKVPDLSRYDATALRALGRSLYQKVSKLEQQVKDLEAEIQSLKQQNERLRNQIREPKARFPEPSSVSSAESSSASADRQKLFTDDPAASFKGFCKGFIASINKTRAFRGATGTMCAFRVDAPYEIDVSKTESLVTPHRGTLIVKATNYENGRKENDTSVIGGEAVSFRWVYRFQFDASDGKWDLKTAEFSIGSRPWSPAIGAGSGDSWNTQFILQAFKDAPNP